MGLDVQVNISTVEFAKSVGFGVPLVLNTKAASAIAYTECSSLGEVVSAGFASTTEVYKTCNLIWMQNNAPKSIAVCQDTRTAVATLTELASQGKNFRQIIVTSIGAEDESTMGDIAAYVETLEDKLYFANVKTTGDAATILNKTRTVCMVLNDTTTNAPANPVAALVGATAGLTPGSFTYKNIILKGVNPDTAITDAALSALHASGLITVLKKAGDIVTSEGITTDKTYIDIVDSRDWIISNIVYQLQKLLNNSLKVPYTNSGIGQLEAVTLGVLKEAYDMGIIGEDDEGLGDYKTEFALRKDVPAGERAARTYVRGKFTAGLAGAIHTVTINGSLII